MNFTLSQLDDVYSTIIGLERGLRPIKRYSVAIVFCKGESIHHFHRIVKAQSQQEAFGEVFFQRKTQKIQRAGFFLIGHNVLEIFDKPKKITP